MPARAPVRTGLVTATSLALALLAGSPALADDLAPLQLGDPCTADTVLEPGLSCINDLVALTPPVVEEPPPVVEEPSPPAVEPIPDPLPIDVPPVVTDPLPPAEVPPVDVGPVLPGQPGTVPGPTTPSDPAVPGGSLSDNAKNDGVPAAAPVTTVAPDRSLLAAATVSTLAASDLPTLAAMRSAPLPLGTAGSPLSAYMPAPLMANLPPNAALAAVQAPLLAAGDDAAGSGGFTLAGLDSKALPGLLVVLATALVAAVGAGNMRAWQERLPQWRRSYARARR